MDGKPGRADSRRAYSDVADDMTVQREDIEPEEYQGTGDWRHDAGFKFPDRLPWSVLGPDFIQAWGFEPKPNKREHLEVVGPSGSGKTYLVETIMQDHYREANRRRVAAGREHIETGGIFVVTKKSDDIFAEMGWPIISDKSDLPESTNLIFWPRTRHTGTARRDYQESKLRPLLDHLWQDDANIILAFDEIGWVENLSAEVRALIQMYWREARSMHIQVIGMKQRPQGALRDMHSETFWTVSFKPGDDADQERFAQLFGHKRDWQPVLDALDLDRHEFLIKHSKTGEAYISWVDTPLLPQEVHRPRGIAGLYGR